MDIINRTNSQLVMITWEEQKEKECERERKKEKKEEKEEGEKRGTVLLIRYGTAPQALRHRVVMESLTQDAVVAEIWGRGVLVYQERRGEKAGRIWNHSRHFLSTLQRPAYNLWSKRYSIRHTIFSHPGFFLRTIFQYNTVLVFARR